MRVYVLTLYAVCVEAIIKIHAFPEEDQGGKGPRKRTGDKSNMYILSTPSSTHTIRQSLTYLTQEPSYLQVLNQKLTELLVFPLSLRFSAQSRHTLLVPLSLATSSSACYRVASKRPRAFSVLRALLAPLDDCNGTGEPSGPSLLARITPDRY